MVTVGACFDVVVVVVVVMGRDEGLCLVCVWVFKGEV